MVAYRVWGVWVIVMGGGSPVPDSWDCSVSPEYVVLPDMSDSDGHSGPGIQNFLLFPIPLARPLFLWQEGETSCQLKCDSLCLTLTHLPAHSLTLFLLLSSGFMWTSLLFNPYYFPWFSLPHFLVPVSFSFVSLLSFALWHLHSFSPFNSLFVLWCSFFSPWNGTSGELGTKIEQVVDTCLVS